MMEVIYGHVVELGLARILGYDVPPKLLELGSFHGGDIGQCGGKVVVERSAIRRVP
jgi:hypothetical protein